MKVRHVLALGVAVVAIPLVTACNGGSKTSTPPAGTSSTAPAQSTGSSGGSSGSSSGGGSAWG